MLRRAVVRRFTRGLTFVDRWALVGGNAHRDHDDDRAEVVVVDLASFAVVERIPMPCLEVYDILLVPPAVVRGAAAGFGANAARAVEQHRSPERPPDRRPAPRDAGLRLVTDRTAATLAAAGRPLDAARARACAVRGTLPARALAGEVTSLAVEVVNRSDTPLATVLPRPVKVGARWRRLTGDDDSGGDTRREMVANPLVPLPRVLPPGMRTEVEVPLEVPAEPGDYEVRVALRQPGLGWLGVRIQGTVSVALGPERGEEHDVADALAVGEQHDQAVHADPEPARGR